MSGIPEYSVVVTVDDLGATPHQFTLRPDPGQRERLARRFDLLSLDRLEASVELIRQTNGDVVAAGVIDAAVAQPCVVSLAPVEDRVHTQFRRRYVDDPEPEMGISEDEDREPLAASLDIGELVAEEFGLALDPFPRAPDAQVPEAATDPPDSPFAVLRRLGR